MIAPASKSWGNMTTWWVNTTSPGQSPAQDILDFFLTFGEIDSAPG